MIALVTGGAGSGKSDAAEKLAVLRARGTGSPLYYVATSVPADDEDRARIRRHVERRAGSGFVTLEVSDCLTDCILNTGAAVSRGTFLVDSTTAYMANVLFPAGGGPLSEDGVRAAAEAGVRDLAGFGRMVRDAGGNVVFVSDQVGCGVPSVCGKGETDFTDLYREALAEADQTIAEMADQVIEVSAGIETDWKIDGNKPEEYRDMNENGELIFVYGGAWQGQERIAGRFRRENPEMPVVPHFEERILELIREGRSEDGILEAAGEVCGIVVMDDITQGVVPVEAEARRWRKMCGRAMEVLAGRADRVVRVFCGMEMNLK